MIAYHVDMQDLTRIEKTLRMTRDKSKLVLKGAINDTVKQTVNLLTNEAVKEYYIGRSKVKKTLNTDKATTGNLEAVITSSGAVNELYDFRVRPKHYDPKARPKAGHTGNVKRDNSAKRLYLKPSAPHDKYKAFVVKYKSGHITIAQRVPGKRMKSNPEKEAINTLLSSSTPNILGYEKGVYGAVKPQMNDLLMKNIQQQMQRYLG